MWTFTNTDLPATTTTNNPTVQGLELFELGTETPRSPLFRSSVLSNLDQSAGGGSGINPPPGEVQVIDNTPLVPDADSYFYKISGLLDFQGQTKVNSINLLDVDHYTFLQGSTYLLTSENTVETSIDYLVTVPNHDASYTYKIDLSGQNIESIDKIEVEGLVATFNYDVNTKLLTLLATKSCKPKPGKIATIKTEKTLNLTNLTRNKVYLFDYSNNNITAVYYLDYLGKRFYLSSSLKEGTLFNNYLKKLAVAIA